MSRWGEPVFPDHWPIVGICGYSGSGKTTLIESLVRSFSQIGWTTGVIKLVHGMEIDREGKDSDRFYRCGASVFAYDSSQWMLRQSVEAHFQTLEHGIRYLMTHNDLVLVEGHKSIPLPIKIWIQSDAHEDPPGEAGPVIACLGRNSPRLTEAFGLIRRLVEHRARRKPVMVGIRAEGHMEFSREQLLEAIGDILDEIVVIGDGISRTSGETPKQLSPATDVPKRIASIVAALRWAPDRRWMFLPTSPSRFDAGLIGRLIDSISPRIWAAFAPSDHAPDLRMCSCMDARFLDVIMTMKSIDELMTNPRVSLIAHSTANT